MINALAVQSLGPALGAFLGVLIGLGLRRRSGKTGGVMGGSIFLTASAAGGIALIVTMAITYATGGAA
jgi:hypothetical protein